MTSADDWISGLPSELAAQRALLHRLLAAVTVDQQWDWLELGCSVAEGRGDALSDLDVALGYATAGPRPSRRSLPWSRGSARWWRCPRSRSRAGAERNGLDGTGWVADAGHAARTAGTPPRQQEPLG